MAGTAKRKVKKKPSVYSLAQPIASMEAVSAKAKKITPAELKKSLMAAGIIGSNGKLAPKYSLAKKAAVK